MGWFYHEAGLSPTELFSFLSGLSLRPDFLDSILSATRASHISLGLKPNDWFKSYSDVKQ